MIVFASCNVLQMFIKSLKSAENTPMENANDFFPFLCSRWKRLMILLGISIPPSCVTLNGKIRRITTSPPGCSPHRTPKSWTQIVEATSAMLHWPRAMYLQRAMRPSRYHPSMVGQNALLAVETRSVKVWYKFRGAAETVLCFCKVSIVS